MDLLPGYILCLWITLVSLPPCYTSPSSSGKFGPVKFGSETELMEDWKKLSGSLNLKTLLDPHPDSKKKKRDLHDILSSSDFIKLVRKLMGESKISDSWIPYALLGSASHELYQEAPTLSKSCENKLLLLAQGLIKAVLANDTSSPIIKQIEAWLDADAKPGSGLLLGNGYWLGAYRECKRVPSSKYCVSNIKITSQPKLPIIVGLCVPRQCNETDTFTLISGFFRAMNNISRKDVFGIERNNALAKTYGSPVVCNEKTKYSVGTIAALCVCGFLGFLILLGTMCELLQDLFSPTVVVINKANGFMPVVAANEDDPGINADVQTQRGHASPIDDNQPLLAKADVQLRKGNILTDVLLCFSIIKNTKSIFNTDSPKGAITSLNGIRTLSMFWVILGHTYFFGLYSGVDNILIGLEITHRFTFLSIANAFFSVDSFFFLSGLLVAYLSLRRFESNSGYKFYPYFFKKFLPPYFIHRFLRLTPSYMFVILFYTYIFPLIGDGPLWFMQARGGGPKFCKKYWWTNILYINNLYPTTMGEECIGWSWYLANDMQFYIISPLILLFMYWYRMAGNLVANGILLAVSFAITGYIIGSHKLNTLLTGDFDTGFGTQAQEFADMVYIKPYCRIAPYLVGLFLGYVLRKKVVPRPSYKPILGCFGWIIATVLGLSVVYGPWKFFRAGGEPFTLVENIFYGTFSRFVWGLSCAWVVYACHNGMGGLINKVLSWRAFIPLSRLTYSAYLVHPIIIYIYYSSLERPMHYSDISIVYWFLSFITMAYSCAYILAVGVELPTSNLEKLVFHF